MSRDEIALVQTCPAPDELSAFNRGRLTLEKLESIAEHLSFCERCESSLQSLQSEDTFLSHLRHPPPEAAVDEFAIVQLADRARAIAARPTDIPTVAHDAAVEEHIAPPLSAAFGAYLLLERLGQGGMGVVYKARQESLKRLVALKMVRTGVHASAEERARFQREGEAIARVKHPHVVQIHECGEHGGQPYFSMELLEGGTLADRLDGGPLPPRAAAELVRSLARAVQAAHQHEVVHRDLKPANVLFAADGTAKITDFGLARVLDSADNPTLTDVILGTPSYMAPEQARGENRSIGPAADVYALGAILYEALTGQPPFRSDTRLQTLELVRTREPDPPTRHRPGLSRDLEAICLKCLEKKAAHRYATAEALADDLGRWLDGEPTRARPPSSMARVRRLARRHPRVGVAVVLAVLLPLIGLAAWRWFDPQRPVRAFERRLVRGEKVTLIGETGGPLWSRWGLRQGVSNPMRLKDGAFSMTGLDYTVLTLLPDPQRSYSLSAEVRHEHALPNGAAVGLAFLYSRHDMPQAKEHCLCVLSFNDLEANVPDPNTGQMVSRIELMVVRVPESGPETAAEFGPDRASITFHKHFVPAVVKKPGERVWRPLAVEVRPQGVDLFWEEDHLAHISHETIQQEFQHTKNEFVNGRPVDPLPDLRPAFSPRDALGLFVARGQASFRHVEVTPLPEP